MKCISVLHLKCVSYCPCFYWQTWFYKMPTFIYRDQLLVQQRSLILCWHYVLPTIHVVWESKIVFIHYVTSIKSCTSMICITQPVFLCALFLWLMTIILLSLCLCSTATLKVWRNWDKELWQWDAEISAIGQRESACGCYDITFMLKLWNVFKFLMKWNFLHFIAKVNQLCRAELKPAFVCSSLFNLEE